MDCFCTATLEALCIQVTKGRLKVHSNKLKLNIDTSAFCVFRLAVDAV